MVIALRTVLISRAFPEQHRLDGLQHDDQVEGNRHVLDVKEVILELLHRVFDTCGVGVAHLAPASKSGLDNVSLRIKGNQSSEPAHELRALWPRSDEAHVSS